MRRQVSRVLLAVLLCFCLVFWVHLFWFEKGHCCVRFSFSRRLLYLFISLPLFFFFCWLVYLRAPIRRLVLIPPPFCLFVVVVVSPPTARTDLWPFFFFFYRCRFYRFEAAVAVPFFLLFFVVFASLSYILPSFSVTRSHFLITFTGCFWESLSQFFFPICLAGCFLHFRLFFFLIDCHLVYTHTQYMFATLECVHSDNQTKQIWFYVFPSFFACLEVCSAKFNSALTATVCTDRQAFMPSIRNSTKPLLACKTADQWWRYLLFFLSRFRWRSAGSFNTFAHTAFEKWGRSGVLTLCSFVSQVKQLLFTGF